MPTRPLELETELFELARRFAAQIVREAFRARVHELNEVTAAAVRAPRLFPFTLDLRPSDLGGRSGAPAPRAAESKVAAAEDEGGRARAKRGRPPGKRATPRSAAFDPPPSDDADAMANVITDPGLLLGVIAGEAPSAARSPRVVREPVPGLLSQSALRSSASEDQEGPALRPGERVQRTAGGSMVLLRRGRR